MSCMKCGKAADDGQVFCARCLAVMESYPVKPDTHIQLPVSRMKESAKKQVHKGGPAGKQRTAKSLRRQICWMWVAIVLLALAVVASLGREVEIPEIIKEPGKNYTYTEPTT